MQWPMGRLHCKKSEVYGNNKCSLCVCVCTQVYPPSVQEVATMLENATADGGLIDNLFVGADIKVGAVARCIGKFLNEEADGVLSVATTTTTTTTTSE